MNTLPQAAPSPDLPVVGSSSAVIMGRQDFLSVLLRLTEMELYKIRRRVMSKVLASIALVAIVVTFVALMLVSLIVLNSSGGAFLPPACTQSGGTQPCLNQSPTQAQIDAAKLAMLRSVSEPLRPPSSLTVAAQVALTPFTILIIILAGAIAGGEYSLGTIRLLFTRGPTRTQFFLAKLLAIIVCSAVGILVMVLVGTVLGLLLNLITGIGPSWSFFSAGWLGHTLLYLLFVILNWVIFAVIAIFFGILGRATVAGIVGGVVWFLLEPVVGQVFTLAGSFVRGSIGDTLRALPDYLIGNNIGALIQNQAQYVSGGSPGSLSDLHTVLVLLVYLAVLLGLAWWLNERRDITS